MKTREELEADLAEAQSQAKYWEDKFDAISEATMLEMGMNHRKFDALDRAIARAIQEHEAVKSHGTRSDMGSEQK
jgi:hypothetical protein